MGIDFCGESLPPCGAHLQREEDAFENSSAASVVQHTITLMDGVSFSVEVARHSTVADIQEEISRLLGCGRGQQLFVSNRDSPLNQCETLNSITNGHNELFLVFNTVPIEWLKCGSDLKQVGGVAIHRDHGYDPRLATCNLVMGNPGDESDGYLEVEIKTDNMWGLFIGAMRPGLAHNASADPEKSFFLSVFSGGLYGNGKRGTCKQGEGKIKKGDRVGVAVQLSASGTNTGTIKFFVNGVEFGPGFEGLAGSLVFGIQVSSFRTEPEILSIVQAADNRQASRPRSIATSATTQCTDVPHF